jgi:hypothetical protein
MMDDRASAQEESGEEMNLVEKLNTFRLSTKTPITYFTVIQINAL